MLVSCLIPTANREHLIPLALKSIFSQTYSDLEIVIIDNGDKPLNDKFLYSIQDYTRFQGRLLYKYIESHITIGELRNIGCEMARGEVIIHYDDDDWSSKDRIVTQLGRLYTTNSKLTGFHEFLTYDTTTKAVGIYVGGHPYACGASQCYYKSWWEKHPFQEIPRGEDTRFSLEAQKYNQLDSISGTNLLVVRKHRHYEPIQIGPPPREYLTAEHLPKDFLNDLAATL